MSDTDWQPSACILCECNCGIEIRLGADGHSFDRIRGDKAHPASQGYTCEKALRLDHYQNHTDRLTSPLRRRPDGTFEKISWEVAIREVAERFAAVRDAYAVKDFVATGHRPQRARRCPRYLRFPPPGRARRTMIVWSCTRW